MLNIRPFTWPRVLMCLAAVLILKVTINVVLKYADYLPPNFESDFLHGRGAYFWGGYHWAFYAHLVAGPISLILGMLLLSERFRLRFPKSHRYLGRVQVVDVLCIVAPTGLAMACRAEAGPVAGLGFALLALATGTSVALGWRRAVQRQFAEHRRWMSRCYVLLCSTVMLRLAAGLATVTDFQATWFDPVIAWASWLVPLAAFELTWMIQASGRVRRGGVSVTGRDLTQRRADTGSAGPSVRMPVRGQP